MEVIVISETKQQFNGLNYWKGKRERYYRNAGHKPHSLHRAVWEYHNGPIPSGMVIDHIDRNSDNNQIQNLRLVTQSENNRNVSEETTMKRRETARKNQPATKKWHSSEEGRSWHSEHGKDSWKGKEKIAKNCAHCGSVYYTRARSEKARFCSENCKMLARRRRLMGLPESTPKCSAKNQLQKLQSTASTSMTRATSQSTAGL